MTKVQRRAIAEALISDMADLEVTCSCKEHVEQRRAFNLKLLTTLLVPLVAEGGG